jgi:thioredoxin-like negative regulator of GroEL
MNRYLELMQKQRLEFEDTLARKLRDQEDALTRQANALLQEKEAGINAVVNATRESLEMEHETNLASTKELLEAQLSAKYEAEFAQKLAEEKQKFSQDLQQKVDMMEQLSRKLEAMESALSVSRSFSDGSLKAHRVSAAALALADKLETSKSAMDEVVALMVSEGSPLHGICVRQFAYKSNS